MTTITAPTQAQAFNHQLAAFLAAVVVMVVLAAALVVSAAGAPAAPSHDLTQNTTPIYIDTTPLSGPSMY
jgi:hypothetical protein